jgi:hypothetical protein
MHFMTYLRKHSLIPLFDATDQRWEVTKIALSRDTHARLPHAFLKIVDDDESFRSARNMIAFLHIRMRRKENELMIEEKMPFCVVVYKARAWIVRAPGFQKTLDSVLDLCSKLCREDREANITP